MRNWFCEAISFIQSIFPHILAATQAAFDFDDIKISAAFLHRGMISDP